MYAMRLWSVRHARLLERVYEGFERWLVRAEPLLARVGYARLERPVAALERGLKGVLFDCQMCGQCILGATGLACPMNCPKQLRNGPCGGVRTDGNCEVEPQMRCVWVEAYEGSRRMRDGGRIAEVQFAVDHSLAGRSAWLRRARQLGEQRALARAAERGFDVAHDGVGHGDTA